MVNVVVDQRLLGCKARRVSLATHGSQWRWAQTSLQLVQASHTSPISSSLDREVVVLLVPSSAPLLLWGLAVVVGGEEGVVGEEGFEELVVG